MPSFLQWLRTYCSIQLNRKDVEHELDILKLTTQKVEPANNDDHRWSFKAKLKRNFMDKENHLSIPEDELIFTVVYNGEEQYVTIVGIDGTISELPKDRMDSFNSQEILNLLYQDETEKAVTQLLPWAEKGGLEAQKLLGSIYHENKRGWEALKWYVKVTEQNDVEALYGIGSLYFQGIGVEQNDTEAFKWFKFAADKGHTQSIHNIGWAYMEGKGVDQDYREAFKWFQKAAEQNFIPSQCNLAKLYLQGTGVEKNANKAVELYSKAINEGYAVAFNGLAICYQLGEGLEKNETKAFEYFKIAAEDGYDVTQNNLGICYQQGIEVGKNEKMAFHFYMEAAE